MADPEATAAILKRALDYPYAAPERSYLYREGEALELPGALDLTGRSPLLAYGANASPQALARKLAPRPGEAMPVLRAELAGFDVVYSAHVSPYGAIPGTLFAGAGTVAPVFVVYPSAEQLRLLTASEPNYELRPLERIECRVEEVGRLTELDAYLSRHGCLRLDRSEVALAALATAGRTLPALDQRQVLERVRDLLEPGVSLEQFVPAAAGNRIVFD
jgi:hypothetical protein